jgi:pimeloyl-ACP methyl ester carboxylesterase
MAQTPTPVHDRDSSGYYKSFDGASIYYESHGKGFPVVLVHGFIVNGESWKKTNVYHNLAAKGYRVITMDLRGNGRSSKLHNPEAYAKDAEAKDVMGLLTHLGINAYHLVGYSRGSIIAARLLVLDSRIKKAVIGGMGDGFTDPNWPRRVMFYHALSGEPVKELEQMVNYVKTSGLDQQALACMQKEQPSCSQQELGKIQEPVLVISGDKDPDNGSPERLAAMILHSTVLHVPGDHSSTLRSEAFSAELISFLEKK